MPAKVNPDVCVGCEACTSECPCSCIAMKDGKACVGEGCVDCGACVAACPVQAITL